MDTKLETRAGIELHAGKTRIWNRAGIRRPNIDDLGEDVWSPDGVKILGSPLGTEAFVLSHSPIDGSRKNDASGTQSRQCLISNVRGSCCCNVQGHVVVMCCGPPVTISEVCQTRRRCTRPVGRSSGKPRADSSARAVVSLPMRMGGLGLRSARGLAPSACWASWADALAMLQNRLPTATNAILEQLQGEPEGCLGELRTATRYLDRDGLWQTKLGGVEGRSKTSSTSRRRSRRMATRLAELRIFRFGTPFWGERSTCPIMLQRPGSPSIRSWCSVPWFVHWLGVSGATPAVLHTRVGTVAPDFHRS